MNQKYKLGPVIDLDSVIRLIGVLKTPESICHYWLNHTSCAPWMMVCFISLSLYLLNSLRMMSLLFSDSPESVVGLFCVYVSEWVSEWTSRQHLINLPHWFAPRSVHVCLVHLFLILCSFLFFSCRLSLLDLFFSLEMNDEFFCACTRINVYNDYNDSV